MAGIAYALAAVTVCTVLIFPLRAIAPPVSTGVVYLLGPRADQSWALTFSAEAASSPVSASPEVSWLAGDLAARCS